MTKRSNRPGGSGRVKTVAPGQVIEGQASDVTAEPAPLQEIQEVNDVKDEAKDEAKATEAAVVEEAPPRDEDQAQTAVTQEEPATLANGSTVSPDTVMQCGRCQARFYAKDAPEGSCPATDAAQNVCGGVLGPVA